MRKSPETVPEIVRFVERPPSIFSRLNPVSYVRNAFSGNGGRVQKAFSLVGEFISSYLPYVQKLLAGSHYDYKTEAGDVYDNAVVQSGIQWIWKHFLQMQIGVYRADVSTGKLKWIVDTMEDTFTPVWEKPYYHDHTQLLYGIITSWATNGNAFLYKIKNPNTGLTVSYVYVPHYMLVPKIDGPKSPGKAISYYDYYPSGGGVPLKIPEEDIVHLKYGVDPNNPLLGLSPLAAALREVCTENNASTLAASLLRNGGVPNIALSPKDGSTLPLTPKKRAELKDSFKTSTTGEQAGSPIFFPFAIEAKQIGYSPKELSFPDLRGISVSRICACLNIDPMVIGLPSAQKTYSNLEVANEAAVEKGVLPMATLLSLQLTLVYRSDFLFSEGKKIMFDLSEIRALQEDVNSLHERVRLDYQAGILKRKEAKEQIGEKYDDTEDDVYIQDLAVSQTAEKSQLKREAVGKAKHGRQIWEILNAEDPDELVEEEETVSTNGVKSL